MNKNIIKFICSIMYTFLLIGCGSISDSEEEFNYNNEFFGIWQIEEVEKNLNKSEKEADESQELLKEVIKINKDGIIVAKKKFENISYKLKVVDENYVISYEDNLTMSFFLESNKTVDMISIVHDGRVLCDFFLTDKNNMILIFESIIFRVKKISDDIIFNDVVDENLSIEENKSNVREGVMLGIKTPRIIDENGNYTEEKYRTIWIGYKDGEIASAYEKQNIIFPRMNDIWTLEFKEKSIGDKHYDYIKSESIKDTDINSGIEIIEIDKDEYKSIKFIANNYIGLEKYCGNNFQGEYSEYQMIPVDKSNSDEGLDISQLHSTEAKEKYKESFEKTINSISDSTKEGLEIGKIDYSSFTMERSLGKWVLVGKISSKEDGQYGLNFPLHIATNKNILNHNKLFIPWKTLKGELPLFKDVYTSSLGKLAIVQYRDYLSVYRISNGNIEKTPILTLDIDESDEIIMAEWCTDLYVDQWEKVFLDGIDLLK